MQAETAYNVIQALEPKELNRLYKMLGIAVDRAKKKKQQIITDEQATEFLLGKLNKQKP